ncbi:gtp-binding protein alpha subunit [Anaeramoeba flamelloides]|uniref:Gtp-binding protein alpha subunit n=1 Tax=Anaeramoeba flamelloides TaxID=1746091 RepID=A0ABQ8YR84_9EUKA|nr:gtp-binding protein alpha subunit [Anaeramoeba flamelloides]
MQKNKKNAEIEEELEMEKEEVRNQVKILVLGTGESGYLDDLYRIGDTNYSPNDKDILWCRIPTTGLNKISFNFGETPWKYIFFLIDF